MFDSKNTPFQAFIGQQNRLLKLSTPIGEDFFLPQCVVAQERLSSGYDYTIDCIVVHDDIELKKLIAQPVTLWVQQADRRYLPVHGYVHTMKRLGSDGQFVFCQMSFAPWLHFLRFRKDARIWQERTADDILTDVFNGHSQARGSFRFDLREPALSRSYCTQYESDWHFAQRLMEEEGWFGYHEQKADGSGHVLVITDSTDRLKPVTKEQVSFHGANTDDELERILHWSADRYLGSSQYTIRTHDYKAPNFLKQSNTIVREEYGALPGQLEVYEYAGAYAFPTHEQGEKRTRLHVEHWESNMKRFSAVSGVRSMRAGGWFTLEDHPAHRHEPPEDRQFIVVAVEWCIENNLPFSGNGKHFPGNLWPRVEAAKADMGRRDTAQRQAGAGKSADNEHTGHCFNRRGSTVKYKGTLEKFYGFFEKYGAERLNGLDETYFYGLAEHEKEEAWKFLEEKFYLSEERISGLYFLDKDRAIELFKKSLEAPIATSPFPAERKAIEGGRMLMLRYVLNTDPDEKYLAAMNEFSSSEFPQIRAHFAQSLPLAQAGQREIDVLKKMIFTETERAPLANAITKLMAIYGREYDRDDPVYRSIYLSLKSENVGDKLSALRRLESGKSSPV